MKVFISYHPQEQETAAALFKAARQILPRARVHQTDNKAPFIHVYLTTRNTENPHSTRETN